MPIRKKLRIFILTHVFIGVALTQSSQASHPEILLLMSAELSERHTSFVSEVFNQYQREVQPSVDHELKNTLLDFNQLLFQFGESLKLKSNHVILARRDVDLKTTELNAAEIQLALGEKGGDFKKSIQLRKELGAKLRNILNLNDKIFEISQYIEIQMNQLAQSLKAIDETSAEIQKVETETSVNRYFCGFHMGGVNVDNHHINSIKAKFLSMDLAIRFHFGPCSRQLYSLYQSWKQGNAVRFECASQFPLSLGQTGNAVWRGMHLIREHEKVVHDLRRQVVELKEAFHRTNQNLGMDYVNILQKRKALRDQNQSLKSLTYHYTQQIAQEHKTLESKQAEIVQKSSDQINLFQILFRLKMELSQLEFEILNRYILFELGSSMNLPGNFLLFKQMKKDFEKIAFQVEVKFGGEIDRHYNFFEWMNETEVEKKDYSFSQKLVLKKFQNQKKVSERRLEGQEKDDLIEEWYHQWVQNQTKDPQTVYPEGFFELFTKEHLDQFKKTLFKKIFEHRAELIQVNLMDGESCYQLKMNQKTYWINPNGEIEPDHSPLMIQL